jgi:hypothetical protein
MRPPTRKSRTARGKAPTSNGRRRKPAEHMPIHRSHENQERWDSQPKATQTDRQRTADAPRPCDPLRAPPRARPSARGSPAVENHSFFFRGCPDDRPRAVLLDMIAPFWAAPSTPTANRHFHRYRSRARLCLWEEDGARAKDAPHSHRQHPVLPSGRGAVLCRCRRFGVFSCDPAEERRAAVRAWLPSAKRIADPPASIHGQPWLRVAAA